MEAFSTVSSIAVPFDQDGVDTDQIIPARFLKFPRKDGYGNFLFHDQRFDEQGEPRSGFILNRPEFEKARILVGGENFGCGSSREGAVYALADFGFRAVIAPSFGPIFHNNCFKNGLLPVRLARREVEEICSALRSDPGGRLTVDLQECVVRAEAGATYRFTVDPFWQAALLKGVDEIGLTLTHADQIAEFEKRYLREMDWLT